MFGLENEVEGVLETVGTVTGDVNWAVILGDEFEFGVFDSLLRVKIVAGDAGIALTHWLLILGDGEFAFETGNTSGDTASGKYSANSKNDCNLLLDS